MNKKEKVLIWLFVILGIITYFGFTTFGEFCEDNPYEEGCFEAYSKEKWECIEEKVITYCDGTSNSCYQREKTVCIKQMMVREIE